MPASALVFAPAPALTVTVERADGPGDEIHLHAGGQGFWVARLLVALGLDTVLAGSFGGETGPLVQLLVSAEGIRLASVDVEGANGAYVHDRRGGDREEVARQLATPLGRHAVDELYSTTLAAGLDADVAVLGGWDPDAPLADPDLYRRLCSDLRSAGRPVVADLSGPLREAAAAGGPTILKTSAEDLATDGLLPAEPSVRDVADAIGRIRGDAEHVVVTRADEPAVAWSGGQLHLAAAPRFEALDHRGAGDSMTAGLAAGLAVDADLAGALRLGVAAAALNVTRRGLGSGAGPAIRQAAGHVEVSPVEA